MMLSLLVSALLVLRAAATDLCSEDPSLPPNTRLLACTEYEQDVDPATGTSSEPALIHACRFECKPGYKPPQGKSGTVGFVTCDPAIGEWKPEFASCYPHSHGFEPASWEKLVSHPKAPQLHRPVFGKLPQETRAKLRSHIEALIPRLLAADSDAYSSGGGIFRRKVDSLALDEENAPNLVNFVRKLAEEVTGRPLVVPADKARGWQPIWLLRYHKDSSCTRHSDFTKDEEPDRHLTILFPWFEDFSSTDEYKLRGGELILPDSETGVARLPCAFGNFAVFHGLEQHEATSVVLKDDTLYRWSVGASFQYAD